MQIFPVGIFIFTLFLIFRAPFGLKFGTASFIGAIFTLIFGFVSFGDLAQILNLTYEANIAFIALIIISMTLDENGFFKLLAFAIFKKAKNVATLFVFVLLLCAVLSAFFANDGAVLVATPLLLALLLNSNLAKKQIVAFMLAASFMIDAASSAFAMSNLTNILSVNFFEISFSEFAKKMFLPNLICVFSSIIALFWYFRKSARGKIRLKFPEISQIKDQLLFKFQIAILLVMFVSLLKFSLCYTLLVSAILLLFAGIFRRNFKLKTITQNLPYQVIIFSFCIYVVLFGVKNSGILGFLAEIFAYSLSISQTFANLLTGFVSAILSSLCNNLPALTLINLSIPKNEGLIYANLIGANLGTKLSPIGSLATLLWLHILEKNGVKISIKEFLKCGFSVTFFVLFITLLFI